MNRNEAIMSAWSKIRTYVKENYSNVFTNEVRFRWKHEVYGWKEFGVTPDGIAFIVKGSHGTSAMNEYYYHPTKPMGYEFTKLNSVEAVVNDWQTIKKILNALAEKEKRLYDFEV